MSIDACLSSKTCEWATPKQFFEELNNEFGFTLDPCSTHENAKCEKHYTKLEDGLKQDWGGRTYSVLQPAIRKKRNWIVG